MKKKIMSALAVFFSCFIMCSICFAKIEKEYDSKSMELSIMSTNTAKCGTDSTWQFMCISKDYDFSKKKRIDKADVLRLFFFYRLNAVAEPYISVQVRAKDGSYKSELKAVNNRTTQRGNGYLMNIGFALPRGMITKAVLGNNDSLINMIKNMIPFYLDITYQTEKGYATVSELIEGPVLMEWYEVLEYNLENDPEWNSKMSALFPKKK